MNAKKAKALRRLVYREAEENKKRNHVQDPKTGVIYAVDERRVYQDAKQMIKEILND